MSINDVSVKPPDPIDLETYDSGAKKGSGKQVFLPEKGRYQFEVVGVDCTETTRTQEGYLKAVLTLKTINPGQPSDGHEIRYVNVSTKRYSNRNGSGMMDFLRAVGYTGLPSTDAEYVALANAAMGRTIEAGVNWEAQDPDTREALAKDMNDFPVIDGKRQQYLTRKDDPENKRVWARARVTYYVSKVASA